MKNIFVDTCFERLTMFEALYHITNPAFSSERIEDTQAFAEALGKLLAGDKRKKFALLSGTIFAAKSIPENVQGRLFLEETRDNVVANVYSATSLLKLFQAHEMPIGIIYKKGDAIPFDKLSNYGVTFLMSSPDKWEIQSEGNLRFNLQPFNNVSISNAILPGKFVDIIAAKNLTVMYEGRNYNGITADYVCWDLKKFICHKLILDIRLSSRIGYNSMLDIKNNGNRNDQQLSNITPRADQQSSNPGIRIEQFNHANGVGTSTLSPEQKVTNSSTPVDNPVSNVNQLNSSTSQQINDSESPVPIINNSDYQLSKIRSLLLNKGVRAETVDKILAMHAEFVKTIEVRESVMWKLKQLRWSNMYCYGEGNVIDFTKLSGLVSLVGKNKTGKSSVLDILVYVLFNHINRGSLGDLMCKNISGKHWWVELIFSVGASHQDLYLIKVSRQSNSNDVNLYRNGDLIATGNKTVYQHMENILGPRENFINSVLSIQEASQFLDYKSSAQQQILESLFGLDRLKEKHDEIKSRANSLASELKKLTKPPPMPTEEDKVAMEMLVQISKEEKGNEIKYDSLGVDLSEVSSQLEEVSNSRIQTIENYNAAKTRLEEYQKKITQPQSVAIQELRERIANIEKGCKFVWNSALCHCCKANQQEFSRMTGYEMSKDELERLIRGNRTSESLSAERRIDDAKREVVALASKKDELEKLHAMLKGKKAALDPEFEQAKNQRTRIADLKSKCMDKTNGGLAAGYSHADYNLLLMQHTRYEQRVAELEAEYEIKSNYAAVLDHKSGLGHIILTERAGLVCSRMNELLRGICSFQVKFEFTASQFAISIVQGGSNSILRSVQGIRDLLSI